MKTDKKIILIALSLVTISNVALAGSLNSAFTVDEQEWWKRCQKVAELECADWVDFYPDAYRECIIQKRTECLSSRPPLDPGREWGV